MAWDRSQIAVRAAQERRDGTYVNLGTGIPTLESNYIPAGVNVTLQRAESQPAPTKAPSARGSVADEKSDVVCEEVLLEAFAKK